MQSAIPDQQILIPVSYPFVRGFVGTGFLTFAFYDSWEPIIMLALVGGLVAVIIEYIFRKQAVQLSIYVLYGIMVSVLMTLAAIFIAFFFYGKAKLLFFALDSVVIAAFVAIGRSSIQKRLLKKRAENGTGKISDTK